MTRHGIAFDDGALNRVVEPGRDDEELQKLDLFLLGISHQSRTNTNDASSVTHQQHAHSAMTQSQSRGRTEGARPTLRLFNGAPVKTREG